MIYTEIQMLEAGFTATIPALPHVIRCYEYRRANGNTIVFSSAGKEKPHHVMCEFAAGPGVHLHAMYRIENETELRAVVAGTHPPHYTPKAK